MKPIIIITFKILIVLIYKPRKVKQEVINNEFNPVRQMWNNDSRLGEVGDLKAQSLKLITNFNK